MNNKFFRASELTQEDIELEKELVEGIKNDKEFVEEVIRPMKLSKEVFSNYLFVFLDCQKEFHNCKNCPGLLNCPNEIKGMKAYPVLQKSFVEKKLEICELLSDYNRLIGHYIYAEFDDKFDNLQLKNLKHFRNGNRQQLINALKEKNKAKNKDWLFVYGPKEASKTEFLVSYTNEYAKNNYGNIAFVNINNALEFVKNNYYKNQKEVNDYLDTLSRVDLLVLDGFNEETFINNVVRDQFLLPLIKYRFENDLETAITSRLSLDELTNHLAISKFGLKNALEITKNVYQKLYKKPYYLEHLIL